MTPDRRLDQLEPLMADSLQKIDRLIEGQGQIVELATNTKAELDQVRETTEITARAVANLTISTQKQFDELRTNQEGFRISQEELKANQEGFRISQEELKANQEGFRIGQEELKANQEKLMAGQELILQFLREKLL